MLWSERPNAGQEFAVLDGSSKGQCHFEAACTEGSDLGAGRGQSLFPQLCGVSCRPHAAGETSANGREFRKELHKRLGDMGERKMKGAKHISFVWETTSRELHYSRQVCD